jgi:hypothetical protein
MTYFTSSSMVGNTFKSMVLAISTGNLYAIIYFGNFEI